MSAECDLLGSGAVALGAFLVMSYTTPKMAADLGTALGTDLQIAF